MDPKRIPVNRIGNSAAEVLLYDEIGQAWNGEGITAKQFRADIEALGNVSEINVRINSVGGSIFDGLAIYNVLKNHPAKVNVHIDGVALSMASGVSQAGDRVSMASNGLFMLHNPQAFVAGDSETLRKQAEVLDTTREALAMAYANKSGKTKEDIMAMMHDETWMTAAEARSAGFVDEIAGESSSVTNSAFTDAFRVPVRHTLALANFVKGIEMTKDESSKAGATATATAPETTNTMPTQQPASIGELKALAGADSDFIVNAIDKSWTVAQAQSELLRIVNQRNEDLQKQVALAQKKAPTNQAEGESLGLDPLKNSGAPPEAGRGHQVPMNPIAIRNAIHEELGRMKERQGTYFNAELAMQDILQRRPELFPEHAGKRPA